MFRRFSVLTCHHFLRLITIKTDPQEFQEIVRDIFALHWEVHNTLIYGRNGQLQHGVDIYGRPKESALLFAIQCKVRNDSTLTKHDIEEEIENQHISTQNQHLHYSYYTI